MPCRAACRDTRGDHPQEGAWRTSQGRPPSLIKRKNEYFAAPRGAGCLWEAGIVSPTAHSADCRMPGNVAQWRWLASPLLGVAPYCFTFPASQPGLN